MSTSKIKKYWSEEANAWKDESYTSGGATGENICKACQQEVSELKFGYCSVCRKDIEKADLQLAIRNHIPKDWRIGQFLLNLQLEYMHEDFFYISDDKLMDYWFFFLENCKEKEALSNYIKNEKENWILNDIKRID